MRESFTVGTHRDNYRQSNANFNLFSVPNARAPENEMSSNNSSIRRNDLGATGATELINLNLKSEEEQETPNPRDFVQGSCQSLKPFLTYQS